MLRRSIRLACWSPRRDPKGWGDEGEGICREGLVPGNLSR